MLTTPHHEKTEGDREFCRDFTWYSEVVKGTVVIVVVVVVLVEIVEIVVSWLLVKAHKKKHGLRHNIYVSVN